MSKNIVCRKQKGQKAMTMGFLFALALLPIISGFMAWSQVQEVFPIREGSTAFAVGLVMILIGAVGIAGVEWTARYFDTPQCARRCPSKVSQRCRSANFSLLASRWLLLATLFLASVHIWARVAWNTIGFGAVPNFLGLIPWEWVFGLSLTVIILLGITGLVLFAAWVDERDYKRRQRGTSS